MDAVGTGIGVLAAADGSLGADGRVPGTDVLDDEEFLQSGNVFVEGAAGEGVVVGGDIGEDSGFVHHSGDVAGIGAKDGPGNLGVEFFFGGLGDVFVADDLV